MRLGIFHDADSAPDNSVADIAESVRKAGFPERAHKLYYACERRGNYVRPARAYAEFFDPPANRKRQNRRVAFFDVIKRNFVFRPRKTELCLHQTRRNDRASRTDKRSVFGKSASDAANSARARSKYPSAKRIRA